jgi:pimeloyl-ACP methyl ester carboxylesterase
MASYVLVHGAWHGGWCWHKLTPLLEAAGHRVDALDLPGHGDDRTPVSGMTLEANAARICGRVEEAGEPVVLVGHSMGGTSITQAAELVPDRIALLVYLCAFLPRDGQSLPELAEGDPATLVLPNLVIDESGGTATVAEHALRDAFYGACSDEDVDFARTRLVPESLAAIAAPVAITAERCGAVPHAYVECLRDRAIGIDRQREMHAAVGCERVLALDTDHSPFFSAPRELADHLLLLAP